MPLGPWYAKKGKKSRSGTPWTEAAYAEAGYGRLSLRLPQPVLDRLQTLSIARGLSRAAVVEQLVLDAPLRDKP